MNDPDGSRPADQTTSTSPGAAAPDAAPSEAPLAAPTPEALWAGDFGDAYVGRNAVLDPRRRTFWREIVEAFPIETVLEVGCGQGGNLGPLVGLLTPRAVWGIDVNDEARRRAVVNAPGANVVHGLARALPFRDAAFDLVFTMGVLIHQPDEDLPAVMDEIVRVARRFILCGEYHADSSEALVYRGYQGALFKRDYGRLYAERDPTLRLRRTGYLGPEDGFDRLTYHLFEKPSSG